MQKRTALYRMKMKFAVILGIVFMLSIVFFSVIVSAKEKAPEAPQYKYYTSIQIDQGDTLWTIAEEYCYDSSQLKDYVREIKEINNLKSNEIHAGNYLTIVYYSDMYK